MKSLVLSLVAALTLGAALPALAGPDFQAIEHARSSKHVAVDVQGAGATKTEGTASAALMCPPEALVLPLDHGPRAQTTPGENRVRIARYNAQLKACTETKS